MNRHFLSLLFLFSVAVLGCKPNVASDPSQPGVGAQSDTSQAIANMQGKWVHADDSLATVTVKDHTWIFGYDGFKSGSVDTYRITMAKTSRYVNNDTTAILVLITNKSDTMEYEVLGLSDSLMSLMYFPRGNMHVYRKMSDK